MVGSTFYLFCNIVILVSSTIAAICTIMNLIKKPAEKFKNRQEAELNEKIDERTTKILKDVLPELLKAHDLEVRDKYKADRARYLAEIKESVLKEIQDNLSQIQLLTIQCEALKMQCEALKMQYETLIISAKDVLREKIMKIYNDNKDTKTLTVIDRERLDQFYKDYKELKGNSYIDKYYNRMKKWGTAEDDYDDDDDIA